VPETITYTTTRFFEQARAADEMMFGQHEYMLRLMEELWAEYPFVSVTFDY
jgi:hypothetical protein